MPNVIQIVPADTDKTIRPLIRRFFALSLLLLVLMSPVNCGEADNTVTYSGGFTISVVATSVTSSSIQLAITANFNALNTPFWRTDQAWYLAHFDLQSNTRSFYTDTNVTSGVQYCYKAGGIYFFIGPVYSNLECVIPP